MIKEYLTEHNGQFNCIKYTLSSGNEIILSEDEEEELLRIINKGKSLDYKLEISLLKEELDVLRNLAISVHHLSNLGGYYVSDRADKTNQSLFE